MSEKRILLVDDDPEIVKTLFPEAFSPTKIVSGAKYNSAASKFLKRSRRSFLSMKTPSAKYIR